MTMKSPKEYLARGFAFCAHMGQKYGEDSYILHLDQTNEVAAEFSATHNVRIASFLHDILEDTKVPAAAVQAAFGLQVTLLVQSVTSMSGKNRKERNKGTYPLIRQVGYEAVMLKLCDRIANVRYAVEKDNHRMFDMYKKEHAFFRMCLHQNAELGAMWRHLDHLLVEG